MGVAFPLTPAPAYYASVTPSQPHGVYYVGDGPAFTLGQSGATAYAVRDYGGTVVSSGSVSGTTVTPTVPSGGWKPGWYRLYLTGGSTDALFGPAYGSSMFTVLRGDSRFAAMTTGTLLPSGVNDDDPTAQAILGMGFPRPFIGDASTQSGLTDVQAAVTIAKTYYAVGSGSAYYDAARSRPLMCPFPNGTSDKVTFGGLRLYCKDGTIDGSTITVTAAAGTSSGTKLTINAEVYDNLATADAAVTAINAASLLVKAFGTGSVPTTGTGTIGNAYFNGVKGVVTTLYPDVTRFEGPSNEPTMNAETAHQMRLFQAAVHAGNASALAIGPCPVSIANNAMDPFFAAGGGAYCDEISFHAYNTQTNGDINLGRAQLDAFKALLAKYGLTGKTLWQTESVHVFTAVYGVFHPRRARIPLLQTLQWEQYGVPRERNSYWYGRSHGFWVYPSFWQFGDGTIAPQCALYRTLAEETFGQTHASIVDFGTIGNRIFLGSIYSGAAGKTAVILATSYLPGATVTLAVTGASGPLTAVDGFGNTSSLALAGGQVVVPVTDVPTYLRLPAGASVSVVTCNDWPANRSGWLSAAAAGNVAVASSLTSPQYVNDDRLMFQYTGGAADGVARGTALPDTVALSWPTATRLDRVIIWTGCWQGMSALVDFDVQTSNDGTSWTTRATVTKATPDSFIHGASATGTGCQRETYWDEQWIFDVKLPAPVTAKMVRLNVRATSYGGEPDAACVTAGGQGNAAQFITVQEIAVLCDDNTIPRYGGEAR